MTLLPGLLVVLVASCHAQYPAHTYSLAQQPRLHYIPVVPYYQPLIQPQVYTSVETSDEVQTPLRAAVESQPSELFKAQTRMVDLIKKSNENILGDKEVTLKSGCQEGSYKPHSTCAQYFFCVHAKWTTQSCPDGLHWDNANKICNFPDAAGCDGSAAVEAEGEAEAVVSVPETAPVVAEWEEPERPATPASTTEDWNKPWQPPTPAPRPDYDNRPLSNGLSGDYKIVCYFTNWATYRQTGSGKFDPEDIDYRLCTHIIYGFAVLNGNSLLVKSHDPYADMSDGYSGKDMYRKVTEFKKHGIKVTLALGGWNDSKGDKYSRLVNSPSARARFIEDVIQFIEKHDFDGLDLDWEYPSCWQTDCKEENYKDKDAFTAWVRELSAAFKPKGLLLSAAVSPSKKIMDVGYNVAEISKYLDWINVMTYDYHGQWDKKTGHVAPMYEHPDDDFYFFNANFTMNYWAESGCPKSKLVMGMPLYGQSFTLTNAKDNGLNAAARDGGTAGVATRAKGFLAYHEICRHVKSGWTVVQDDATPPRMGPYATNGNQWVGFDDKAAIARKCNFVKDNGFGGGMVWALDLDDFRNLCGEGSYPLMNVMREILG